MLLHEPCSMETCVLLPEEFSLKLDTSGRSVSIFGHILPVDEKLSLQNSLRVCAAKKVPAQTRFLPFSGTVRTDTLPLLPYLPGVDIRHRLGSYDEIVERSGKAVRLCNWVRFVKPSLTFDQQVNIVATRNRGSVFFETSKEISEGDDIIVFLIPEASETENVSFSALSALRTSLYRQTLDSIMTDAPLDLSKSLFSTNIPMIANRDKQSELLSQFPNFEKKELEPEPPKEEDLQKMRMYLANIRNNSLMLDNYPPRHPLLSPYFPFLHVPPVFPNPPFPLPGLSPVSSGLSSPSTTKPSTPPSPTQSPSSSSTPSLKRPNPFGMGVPSLPPKRRERTMLPCSECGKAFDRPSLLKRHMRTHTGEKPHVCDVCSKGFSTSSSLNTHRRIHSGEKPHQCGVCGKRFTASSNLYYHKMTHIKEKPHKCSLCTRSFPTPGDLRSHMFVHNGQWPHKCGVCGKGFSKLTNLRNHELLHTGDRQSRKTNSGSSSPDINFNSSPTGPRLNSFFSYPSGLLNTRVKPSSEVNTTDCSLLLPSPPLSPSSRDQQEEIPRTSDHADGDSEIPDGNESVDEIVVDDPVPSPSLEKQTPIPKES